jgi:hypothetical protein
MSQPLPFPNGALDVGMEIAFGADITANQDDWEWTDVSSSLTQEDVTTIRGRQDESSDVQPTQAPVQVDNPDGDFTPDNPVSQYYPNVVLGTPARWWLNVGDSRLFLRPVADSNAHIPSSTAPNVTEDLDVRIDLHVKTVDPSSVFNGIICARANGSQPWAVEVLPDRRIRLVCPDVSIFSTLPILPMSARATLRVTLDVNDGSGGAVASFYLGESVEGPWTLLDTVTVDFTITIPPGSQPLYVGPPASSAPQLGLDADVYAFRLCDGIDGPVIVDADFTAQTSGATSFVDSTGLTWEITPAAELSNRWFRVVGALDSWQPWWPWGDLSEQIPGGIGQGQARTNVEIAGILRRLGQGASPLESPLRRFIEPLPTTRAYWPMEDETNSTQIASALPDGAPMTVAGEVSFASDSDLPGSKPLPTLSATSQFFGAVSTTFLGQWQVDCYAHIPVGPASPTTLLRVTGTGTAVTWLVTISAGAVTVTALNNLGASLSTASGAPDELYGGWVHLRLTAATSGGGVDWAFSWDPIVYPIQGGFTMGNSYAGTVGDVVGVAVPASAGLDGISLGHISVQDTADLFFLPAPALGWQGERAAERIWRLCVEENIYLRLTGESSTTAFMGAQPSATLLDLLDECAQADGGILYEHPYMVGLIYRTLDSLYNQPPNMVLDAHAEQLQNPFRPVLDDQRVRNDVIVTRKGGSSVHLIDEASIRESGDRDESVTLNLFTDSQVADATAWHLHQGTVPGMHYPSISIDLGKAPAVISPWLTCDTGAMVHVINLPPQHPAATVRVMLEGYQEPVDPANWKSGLNCSPGQVWDIAQLDGQGVADEHLMRLDTDVSELDAPVTATATTLQVRVLEGPAWVTDPAEFPLDIGLGGEQITVTAIGAAAGGVQAFTVVRSVNGVVKAHAAADGVQLWYQPVLAR